MFACLFKNIYFSSFILTSNVESSACSRDERMDCGEHCRLLWSGYKSTVLGGMSCVSKENLPSGDPFKKKLKSASFCYY